MNNNRWIEMIMMLAFVGMVTSARGGSLDSPAAPTSSVSAMYTLEHIYNKLNMRSNVVTKRTGAFTEPNGGPTNGTMHTLDDIMTLVTNRVPVPMTGQIDTYAVGDDGTNRIGVAWLTNRFTVQSTNNFVHPDDRTNCVVDNLTSLMWARNANLATGAIFNATWSTVKGTCTWNQAFDVITNSAGPVNGTNYGGYNDWRLPNVRELHSLIDWGRASPALPSGHPFNEVQMSTYWTSTTFKDEPATKAWDVNLYNGTVYPNTKVTAYYVWPVRGGGD
jgi:hypothetical protein